MSAAPMGSDAAGARSIRFSAMQLQRVLPKEQRSDLDGADVYVEVTISPEGLQLRPGKQSPYSRATAAQLALAVEAARRVAQGIVNRIERQEHHRAGKARIRAREEREAAVRRQAGKKHARVAAPPRKSEAEIGCEIAALHARFG